MGHFDTDQLRNIRNLLYSLPRGSNSRKRRPKPSGDCCACPEPRGSRPFIVFRILHELACATAQLVIGVREQRQYPSAQPPHQQDRTVRRRTTTKSRWSDVGELVGVSASSVSRFFKQRTRHNFFGTISTGSASTAPHNDRNRAHHLKWLCLRVQQYLQLRPRIPGGGSARRRRLPQQIQVDHPRPRPPAPHTRQLHRNRRTHRHRPGVRSLFRVRKSGLFAVPQLFDGLFDVHAVGNLVAFGDGSAQNTGPPAVSDTTRTRASRDGRADRFAQPVIGIAQPCPARGTSCI